MVRLLAEIVKAEANNTFDLEFQCGLFNTSLYLEAQSVPDNQKKVFSYMKGKVARVNAKFTEGLMEVRLGKCLAGF